MNTYNDIDDIVFDKNKYADYKTYTDYIKSKIPDYTNYTLTQSTIEDNADNTINKYKLTPDKKNILTLYTNKKKDKRECRPTQNSGKKHQK